MQRIALNSQKKWILADAAEKKVNYWCRECGQVLRLRGGLHIQNHFYHPVLSPSCRQTQKSLVHLHLQNYLRSLLPEGEAELEKQFPEIGRIADVVWDKAKLIFEVQCSPISQEEVASRNQDYSSLGYQVVWILHDRRYNQWRATEAELYLRHFPHYFTNMDGMGRGCIYDQADWVVGGVRRIFRKVKGVNLSRAARITESRLEPEALGSSFLKERCSHWPVYFAGDILDRWMKGEESVRVWVQEMEAVEKSRLKKIVSPAVKGVMNLLRRAVFRPYEIIFKTILEQSCL